MSILSELSRLGRKIIIEHPYYGIFLATLNRKTEDNPALCDTAGVSKNGLNTQLTVHPPYWHKLEKPEKIGTLIHELLHICMFHITMRDSFLDKYLFNIAADIEINQYIIPMKGVSLPKGCLTLEMFGFNKKTDAKKGTRYYYEKLKQQMNKGGGKGGTLQKLYQDMKNNKPTVCSHKTWKEFKDLTPSEKRVIESQIQSQMKTAWENVDKSRSDIPGTLKGTLEELLKPKKSVFDWKGVIRRFTGGYSQETFTKKLRRKHNKRFPEFPGLKIKHRKNLLCAVDTSGSVSKEEFIEFMREIDVIRKTGVNVTVCECDAYVDKDKGIYQFKGLSSISGRKVTGGGGTSFDPPIEYLNEDANKFSAIIYLTDGYAPVPVVKPKKPIMWVMSMNGKSPSDARNEGFPGFIIQIPKEAS